MSASRENKAHAAEDEITGAHPETASSLEHGGLKEAGDNDFEVFKTGEGVNFRTLGWIKASLIFFKLIFATGVLAIPSALYALGALPGALSIVGWITLNTYGGVILGNFRNRHAGCHSVADMAGIVGGTWLREVVGLLFVVTYVICAASGVSGGSTALNALSEHSMCTNWFAFFIALIMVVFASFRKMEAMSWLSWAGAISVFVAIFIVVIGVTQRDRPAAAPQEGPFELGYHVIGSPNFINGMTATATIFSSNAGTSAMLPVISEMRRPQDYKKSLYLCMFSVFATYLSFSLVVYRYCGQWVASPSLGSAGPTIKKIAFGIGFIGLVVTAVLYTHVAAKYCFVRILRGTRHFQNNTPVHFMVWFGLTISLSAVGFILAQAIPIFSYIVGLAGSVGLAPLAIMLPAILWMYDFKEYRHGTAVQKVKFYLHCGMFALGVFTCVGGTYAVVSAIAEAYDNGLIGGAFSCADNSGTVGA